MVPMTQTSRFVSEEHGGGTAFGLFLIIAMLMAGGYAIDVSNVMRERTHLQMAADSAAHAALLARETNAESDAKDVALAVAQSNMPASVFGDILAQEDVVFGVWDTAARSFDEQSGSNSAVQVRVQRNAANSNSLDTYLLHLVGVEEWDLTLTSTYVTYRPTCFREGFVADGVVDLQSNNSYSNGFCIHSNSYVSLNSNNFFEPGTVVSMPDLADLDIPNSGFETNEGLQAALRSGSYNIRILNRIEDIIANIDEPDSPHRPAYINSTITNTITKKTIGVADLVAGRINYWNCSGAGKGTISAGTLVENVVIVSDCEIMLGEGVKVENSVIATTNTSATSFKSPSGFTLGKDDNCASGGGSQLVTMGGMNFAANLQVYGSQLLALGNIEFNANANGIEGVAMVSAGEISGTSNMEMGFCGIGMENNFEAEYFRLVE